jgi:hypothetical protein
MMKIEKCESALRARPHLSVVRRVFGTLMPEMPSGQRFLSVPVPAAVRGSNPFFTQNNNTLKWRMKMHHAAAGASSFRFHAHGLAKDEGSSLVEFAIVLPMMWALIMGMFWFALALNSYVVLTDAVGSGARALAFADGQTTPALAASDPCAYAVEVAGNDATTLNTGNVTYTITWTSGGTTNTYSNSCPGIKLQPQDVVQMQASYPVPIPLWPTDRALTLNASTTELEQ